MKKVLLILALCGLCLLSQKERAVAAACQNTAGYGAVTVQLSTLPSRGTYTIWTRMQAPDALHNRYNLEVNNQACYQVGGSSLIAGEWSWVSFQDGNLSSKVTYGFAHTNDNSLKLIGTDAGVKIDRVLLIKNDCVPVGIGDNCQSDTVTVSSDDIKGATVVPPPSQGPVSGLIIPSQTISLNPNAIMRVVYFVDGKQIPSSDGNALDTTLLSNGSHQVSMQITMSDGTVKNEATSLQVENKENAFSPLMRWVRLNRDTAVLLSSIAGGILLIIAVLLIIRHLRLQKRLLNFHGF